MDSQPRARIFQVPDLAPPARILFGLGGALAVFLISTVDLHAGHEAKFSILYLVPVLVVTWFCGGATGLVLSLLGGTLFLIGELRTGHPFENPTVPYLNTLARMMVFSITVTFLDALRLAYRKQEQLNRELREALANVKMLSGLLPICAWCKKIRDDNGYWSQLESYLREHSEADFTHGICPECEKSMGLASRVGH